MGFKMCYFVLPASESSSSSEFWMLQVKVSKLVDEFNSQQLD